MICFRCLIGLTRKKSSLSLSAIDRSSFTTPGEKPPCCGCSTTRHHCPLSLQAALSVFDPSSTCSQWCAPPLPSSDRELRLLLEVSGSAKFKARVLDPTSRDRARVAATGTTARQHGDRYSTAAHPPVTSPSSSRPRSLHHVGLSSWRSVERRCCCESIGRAGARRLLLVVDRLVCPSSPRE
jgi:hypothetical protein